MYLTGMTHRDELFDLTLRWLNDDLAPEDGRTLTRIFLYESAVSAVIVDRVIAFLGNLFSGPLQTERIRQKQALRRRLIEHLPRPGDRTRQLIHHFEEDPEYFFPRLPIDALLITSSDSQAGCHRPDQAAVPGSGKSILSAGGCPFQGNPGRSPTCSPGKRAAAAGVLLADLVSSEHEMQNDFTTAETEVARRFRDHNVRIPREALTVNDLLGFKIIGEPGLLEQVPALLLEETGLALMEAERHTGDYNAVNLLVEIELPPPGEMVARLKGFDWYIARRRGLDPQETKQGFLDYLTRGSGAVRMEIILTTYDELMESEFGRSMHELRVLRLRQRQNYSGPIAQNAAYLIEYLLALAASPTVHVTELPIKLYGRYLPETIASAKCALFGNDIDGGLLRAFCLNTDCSSQFCSAENLSSGINDRPGRVETTDDS
ncbi:MAG: hypothetical protein U5R30_09410 [Deltaproteobacteria bacterium]|nr:hypothetical protein [Deltaproteobacteria bacterium]